MTRFANQIFSKLFAELWKFLRSLHLFSLDAPLVVVAWKNLHSFSYYGEIYLEESLILGASTWLAYSADRFFGENERNASKDSRHSIGRSHPNGFLLFWGVILLLSFILSYICLPHDIFLRGIILCFFVILNFFLCLREAHINVIYFPKPLRTSVILATSCVFWDINFLTLWEVTHAFLVFLLIFLINCQLLEELEEKLTGVMPKNKKNHLNNSWIFSGACLVVILLAIWFFRGIFSLQSQGCLWLILVIFILRKLTMSEDHFRVLLETIYWIIPTSILLICM